LREQAPLAYGQIHLDVFQSWLLARDLGEALLDFSGAADLDAWLAAHPMPQEQT
jgi:hypothetical protein